jgi:hypothetical protein
MQSRSFRAYLLQNFFCYAEDRLLCVLAFVAGWLSGYTHEEKEKIFTKLLFRA